MVYGFVTTNVPSFVNYARSFGQVTEAPVDVMVAMQARMFARRKVEQRPCDAELLRAMFERTRGERRNWASSPANRRRFSVVLSLRERHHHAERDDYTLQLEFATATFYT